jgi:branched-chain amino acid transport system ATP-binding protein
MDLDERQMLAISRALMRKPKFLLMHEPSMGLSRVMEEEIARVIRTIHEKGIAVLLMEQDAPMALRLANRSYVVETAELH